MIDDRRRPYDAPRPTRPARRPDGRRRPAQLFDAAPAPPSDFERGRSWRRARARAGGLPSCCLACRACADDRSLRHLVRDPRAVLRAHAGSADANADDEDRRSTSSFRVQNELPKTEPKGASSGGGATRRAPGARAAAEARGEIRAPAHTDRVVRARLLARAEAAAGRYRPPLDALLLACWQTLLWRLTGQEEFVVGVAFDVGSTKSCTTRSSLRQDRPRPRDVSRPLTFAAALRRAAESAREAASWQEYFTWDEARAARPGAGPPRSCRALSLKRRRTPSRRGPPASPSSASEATSPLSAPKHLPARGASLQATFAYDAGALTLERVAHFAASFMTLLDAAATSP